MAECREVFTILEDATGEGQPLPAQQEGDDPTSDNGIIGFSFVDSSGNLVLPQLAADGSIAVTTSGAGVCISGTAQSIAGGLTFQDVVTLTLSLTKNYLDLEYSASATHATLWEVVRIDDVGGAPTETKITSFISGPGQFTVQCNLDCGDFNTTGGTGVQNLVLRGKNLRKVTDLHGYLAIKES